MVSAITYVKLVSNGISRHPPVRDNEITRLARAHGGTGTTRGTRIGAGARRHGYDSRHEDWPTFLEVNETAVATHCQHLAGFARRVFVAARAL